MMSRIIQELLIVSSIILKDDMEVAVTKVRLMSLRGAY
jgi:hypothetical protein